jgi:uncharacterized protein
LAHGAGSDCQSPLLAGIAEGLAREGWLVLRYDLPFRQERPSGPPAPTWAARDRAGIRAAVELLRTLAGTAPVCCGGHSYGGRQSTVLAAEDPELCRALLLLSYPLHPPRRPGELRTAHFPQLRTPALFVHGTRDPFGLIDEMQAALALVPGRVELLPVERAGHDLKPAPALAPAIASRLLALLAGPGQAGQ